VTGAAHDRARDMAEKYLRDRVDYPLAYAELWHKDPPRTSQRMICGPASEPTVDAILVAGGHGTGKTHLVAMLAVATAAGRRAPWVQAWCRENGFPLERFPDRMGRALVSGLTGHDLRRFLKPKVTQYLPKGAEWRNEEGGGESEVILPGAPDKMTGRVIFKSNDQKARSYQGDWYDFAGLDEEHDFDVFKEVLERVGRVPGGAGWIVLSMTPLKGRTWVWRRFINECPANYRAVQLHSYDNPHLPIEKLERIAGEYGAHEEAARRRGEFTVLEGAVYPMFDRKVHVVPSFVPDKNWPRYVVIDFGTRNPAAWLWAALDPGDDVLHIYREHYRAGWTIRQHAEAYKAMGADDPKPRAIIADPEDAGARLELAQQGISTIPARKEIRPGINAVAERFALDVGGKTHLVFHDNCANTIREHEGYIWASRGGSQDQPDLPLKANDHTCDDVRYLCYYLRTGRIGVAASTTSVDADEERGSRIGRW
jgi:phage terminase large subunit